MNRPRIQSLLADHHKWHDTYQCRQFIVGKNGATRYGQYKQALRELDTRWNALAEEVCALVELECDQEEHADKLPAETPTAARRHLIESVRLEHRLDRARFALRERVREFYEFYLIADALQKEVGPLTEERRAELSAEEWRSQIETRLALEQQTQGAPSAETLRTVATMRPDHAADLTARLRNNARVLAPQLPPLPETVRVTDALIESTVALAREELGLPPAPLQVGGATASL